jgi:hypothetical protein
MTRDELFKVQAASDKVRKEYAELQAENQRLRELCERLQAATEMDAFYRWHHKTAPCGECHRSGLIQPDPRHGWTWDQWLETAKEQIRNTILQVNP